MPAKPPPVTRKAAAKLAALGLQIRAHRKALGSTAGERHLVDALRLAFGPMQSNV